MRAITTIALAAVIAASATASIAGGSIADMRAEFNTFKRVHNVSYSSAAEEQKRFGIFTENMKKAMELRRRNPHATFGASPYADRSAEEFKTYHNAEPYYKREVARANAKGVFATLDVKAKASAPAAVDWRNQGVVTYVKNQGQCGSCWSFSTTGNIEGQWAIAGNSLVALSEQELVSCDTTNNACNGGLMDNAFEWLIATQGGGIVAETTFPYVSGNQYVPPCPGSMPTAAQISSYLNIGRDEPTMAAWLASNGPISIGVDATSWQTYTGGVLTDCQATQVDHGVLVVGYDMSASPAYWIIKNSWGPSWGEAGYIRIQYGVDACLIATIPCSSQV